MVDEALVESICTAHLSQSGFIAILALLLSQFAVKCFFVFYCGTLVFSLKVSFVSSHQKPNWNL